MIHFLLGALAIGTPASIIFLCVMKLLFKPDLLMTPELWLKIQKKKPITQEYFDKVCEELEEGVLAA